MTHEEFFRQFEEDMKNRCITCKKNCPCNILAKYVQSVGIDKFKKEYYSFTLPKEINDAFNYYFDLTYVY